MTNRSENDVSESAYLMVRGGFLDAGEIEEVISEEIFPPEDPEGVDVTDIIEKQFAALQDEQTDWPDETDVDRLEQVFDRLRNKGIIALHNAGVAQSDGYEDFVEELEEHPNRDRILGYCFYHAQDLDRAILGGGLTLAFGPADPQLEGTAGVEVGRKVIEELKSAGFEPSWDGTFAERITIPEFDWKKRV